MQDRKGCGQHRDDVVPAPFPGWIQPAGRAVRPPCTVRARTSNCLSGGVIEQLLGTPSPTAQSVPRRFARGVGIVGTAAMLLLTLHLETRQRRHAPPVPPIPAAYLSPSLL